MIYRCRVRLLPGPATAINQPKPGHARQTPAPWGDIDMSFPHSART